jgi:hypothetical protein
MKNLADAAGNVKEREVVIEIAAGNISASLSKAELVDEYVANLDDEALLQWATNERGEF